MQEWRKRPGFRVVTLVYEIEGLEAQERDEDWKLYTYTGASLASPSGGEGVEEGWR